MAEFLGLPADERLEALAQAANASGRSLDLLEKDIRVATCGGGFANAAIADRAVADPKSILYAEKSFKGGLIDYHAAVSGGLRLVPGGDALAKLAVDYQHMVDDDLFVEELDSLMLSSPSVKRFRIRRMRKLVRLQMQP